MIQTGAKAPILGSSDPSFRGDPARWNPEELFVASLSACHKLWYLHLCAVSGISVSSYIDEAKGTMIEGPNGGGRFSEVTLRPRIAIRAGDDAALAERLHHEAHDRCFIANSVSIPVLCEPSISFADEESGAGAGQSEPIAAARA